MEECGCEFLIEGLKVLGHAVIGLFLLHHHHKHVDRRIHKMHKENPARPLVEIVEHH